MANKHRGEVEIILDKPRKLRFNTNALMELEEVLGYPLSKLGEDMGITTVVKMFWAGMLHEMPNLTIKEAGDLIDYSDITEVSEKIQEALQLAFGNQDNTPKKKTSGLSSAGKN